MFFFPPALRDPDTVTAAKNGFVDKLHAEDKARLARLRPK